MIRRARYWFALMVCVGVSGCATLMPQLTAPQLTVTAVSFEGGDLQRQRLRLSLHVVNPNDRAIAVRGIEVNLDLAGMPFAMGVSDAALVLPARGASDFALEVTADVSNAVVVIAAGLANRAVDYRLYGEVHLQQGLLRTVHFNQSGRVRL